LNEVVIQEPDPAKGLVKRWVTYPNVLAIGTHKIHHVEGIDSVLIQHPTPRSIESNKCITVQNTRAKYDKRGLVVSPAVIYIAAQDSRPSNYSPASRTKSGEQP
jgi:hypothetical protein